MILTCTFVSAQQTIAFSKSAIEALEKDVKCVNNKGTTTSIWCLYCELWMHFTPCSIISIVNFE